jgi:hypothetical protein
MRYQAASLVDCFRLSRSVKLVSEAEIITVVLNSVQQHRGDDNKAAPLTQEFFGNVEHRKPFLCKALTAFPTLCWSSNARVFVRFLSETDRLEPSDGRRAFLAEHVWQASKTAAEGWRKE